MHFEQLQEFQQFVREKLFPDCVEVQEICAGGSSYNFMVQTPKAKIFIKLLADEQRYLRLQTIWERLNCVYSLPVKRFLHYFLLAAPYMDGQAISYAVMSDEVVREWLHQLQKIREIKFPAAIIAPQQNIKTLFLKTQELLNKDNTPFAYMVKKFFWPRFKSGLISPAATQNVIHGDMTANNVLMHQNKPVLLDFESLRYGYVIEDVATLVLQLSGFRGLYGGNLSKFIKLYKQIQQTLPVNNVLWLYGVQMFYFNRILRRLQNGDVRKRNWRRGLCFLISAYGYFRIERFFRRNTKIHHHGLRFWCKFALYKIRKFIRIIPHNRHL